MEPLLEHLAALMSAAIEAKILATIVALAFIWLVRRVLFNIIQHRYEENVRTLYQSRKTASTITSALAILLIGWIWFEGFESFATFLGLVSAGIAIALKDMLIDLAGWVFILWRQPFSVGDRVQIGAQSGDVIDIRPFQFTILEIGNWVGADQSTGRVIHIPNGKVFSENQANYTQGFQYIWDEIPVLITFESNWQKAKVLLLEIAHKHTGHLTDSAQQRVKEAAQKYMIFYSKLTPIVYTSVQREYGIELTIRYLSEPRRRRGNEQAIWEDILRTFETCPDIDFAYPTQRLYHHRLEHKTTGGDDAPPGEE